MATLDPLGLVLEVGDNVTSEDVPEGGVVSQDPEAEAEVEPGTSVRVDVSSGPAAIDLTSFEPSGADPDDLEERLRSSGLEVERRDEASPDVEAGRVIRLEPSDLARPGETVTMMVSVGNKVQIPPELQGTPRDEARATLTDLGVVVVNEVGVSEQFIKDAGIPDLAQAGIEDQDVVGIQDNGATFGGYVDPGTEVTLVFYDAQLNDQ